MRIISDFHDYYDPIQRVIYDPAVVFHRKMVVEKDDKSWYARLEGTNIEYYRGTIGFAGQHIQLVKFVEWDREQCRRSRICYSVEEAEAFLLNVPIPTCYWYAKKYFKRNKAEVLHRLQNGPEYPEIFERAPIFFVGYYESHNAWKWKGEEERPVYRQILNPKLSEFEFQRIKDPYTAFQELYTYLSAKASPEKSIPRIDDKTMAEVKGFDKWSFRKEPSKK